MITIENTDELLASVGREAVSAWHEITQRAVDEFAELTGDRNPIHVDPEFAETTSFGGTIAHGYYTLSLGPALIYSLARFDGFPIGINYGLNRVRFPAPARVGSNVRMRLRVAAVEEIPGGAEALLQLTFESDRGDKPVCVAESIHRLYGPVAATAP